MVSSGGSKRQPKFDWCFLTIKNYYKIQDTAEEFTMTGKRATLYCALLFLSLC